MFRGRVLLSFAAGVWCVGMLGCGGGAPARSGSAAPLASNLAGNWLLAGSIPQGPLFPASSSSLSVTLSVIGDQLTGSGDVTVFCSTAAGSAGGLGQRFIVSGAVQPDGTFSVQRPALPSGLSVLPITISGSVPSTPGGSWAGQYVVDTSLQGGPCHPVLNGAFSAQHLANVAGTYTGSGTLGLGASATRVSASVALQQGSALPVQDGTSTQQSSVLSGSISITGVPCFHTGSIVPLPPTSVPLPGNVAGDELQADFKMDDGSTLVLAGYIDDADASQLRVQDFVIFNGSCADSSPFPLQFTTLARQN